MASFEQFYPSEVARLVLGYLNDINCLFAWEIFLVECSDLREHYKHYTQGKRHSTNVNGKSLQEILTEYCAVKYKISTEQNGSCSEKPTIPNEESAKKTTEEENPEIFNTLFSFASSVNDDSSSLELSTQDTLTSTAQSICTKVGLENGSLESSAGVPSNDSKKMRVDSSIEKFNNKVTGSSMCNSIFSTSPLKKTTYSAKCYKRKSQKMQKGCKTTRTDNLSKIDKNIQTEIELMSKNFHQSLCSVSTNCKKEHAPNKVSVGISEQENCIFNKHVSALFTTVQEKIVVTPLKKRKSFIPKRLLTFSVIQETVERQNHLDEREVCNDMIILEKLLSCQPLVKNICDAINKTISGEQEVILPFKDSPLLQNISEKFIKSAINVIECDPFFHSYMPLHHCRKDFSIGKLKQKSSCNAYSEPIVSDESATFLNHDILFTDVPLVDCAFVCNEHASNCDSNCRTNNEMFLQNKKPLESNSKKNMLVLVPDGDLTVSVDKGLAESFTSVEVSNFSSSIQLPQVSGDSDAMQVNNSPSTVLNFSVRDAMSVKGVKSLSSIEDKVLLTNAATTENIKHLEHNVSLDNIEQAENIIGKESILPLRALSHTSIENKVLLTYTATTENNKPLENIVSMDNIEHAENIVSMENIVSEGNIVPLNTLTHTTAPMANIVLMNSIAPMDNITTVDNVNVFDEETNSVSGVPINYGMISPPDQLLKASTLFPESIFLPPNQNSSVNNLIMNNGNNNVSNLMFQAFPNNNNDVFSTSNALLSQVPYSGLSTFFLPTTSDAFPLQNNLQYGLIISPNINWNCCPSSDNVPLQAGPEYNLENQHDVTGNTNSCVPVDQLPKVASGNVATTKKITPKKSTKCKKSPTLLPKIKVAKTKKVCSKKNTIVIKSPASSNQKKFLQNKKYPRILPFPVVEESTTPSVDNVINLGSIHSYLHEFCNESLTNIAETDELPTEIVITKTQMPPVPDSLVQTSLNIFTDKYEKHLPGSLDAATEEKKSCTAPGNIDGEPSHQVEQELYPSSNPNVNVDQSLTKTVTTKYKDLIKKSKSKKTKESCDSVKKMANANKVVLQSPNKIISNIKVTKKVASKSKLKEAKKNNLIQCDHNVKSVENLTTPSTIPQNVSKNTNMTEEVLHAMQEAIKMKSLVTLGGSKLDFLNLNSEVCGSSEEILSFNLNESHSDSLVTKESVPLQLECNTLKSMCFSEAECFEKSYILSSNSGLGSNMLTPEIFDNINASKDILQVSSLETLSSEECQVNQNKETNSSKKVAKVSKREEHIFKRKSKKPPKKKMKQIKYSEDLNLDSQKCQVNKKEEIHSSEKGVKILKREEHISKKKSKKPSKKKIEQIGFSKDCNLDSQKCQVDQNEEIHSSEKGVQVLKREKHISKKKSKKPSKKKVEQIEYSKDLNLDSQAIKKFPSQTQSPSSTKLILLKKNCRKSLSPRYPLRKYKKNKSKDLKSNALELVQKTGNEVKTLKRPAPITFQNSFTEKTSLSFLVSSCSSILTSSFNKESESLPLESFLNATEQSVSSQELFIEDSFQAETPEQIQSKKIIKPESSVEDILKDKKILNGELCSDSNHQPFLKKAIVVLKRLDKETLLKAMYTNPVASSNMANLPSLFASFKNSQVETDSLCMEENSLSSYDHSMNLTAFSKKNELIPENSPNCSISKSELRTNTRVFPLEDKFANAVTGTEDKTKSNNLLKQSTDDLFSQSPSKCKIAENVLSSTFPVENEHDNIATKNKPDELSHTSLDKSVNANFSQSPLNTTNDILQIQQLIIEESLTKSSEIDTLKIEMSSRVNTVERKIKNQIAEKCLDNISIGANTPSIGANIQSHFSDESIGKKEHIKTQPVRSPVVGKKRKLFNAFTAAKQKNIDSQCANNDLKNRSSPTSVTISEPCCHYISDSPKSILKKPHEKFLNISSSVTGSDSDVEEHKVKRTMKSRPSLKVVGFITPPKQKKDDRLPNAGVPKGKAKDRTSFRSSSHIAAQIDSSLLAPKLRANVQPSLKSHVMKSKHQKENNNSDINKICTNEVFKENEINLDVEKAGYCSNSKLLILPSQDNINQVKSNHDDEVLCAIVVKEEILSDTMITNSCKSDENNIEIIKHNKSPCDFNCDAEKKNQMKESPCKYVPANEKQMKSLLKENNERFSKRKRNLSISKVSVNTTSKKNTTSENMSPSDDGDVILFTKEIELPEQKDSLDPVVTTTDSLKLSPFSIDRKYDSDTLITVEKLCPESNPETTSHENKEPESSIALSNPNATNTPNEAESLSTSKNAIVIDLTLPACNNEEVLSALSLEMAKSTMGVNAEEIKELIREYGFENLMNLLNKKE